MESSFDGYLKQGDLPAQLARAYTEMGDLPKAKAAYADLFSIWKAGDRDLQLATDASEEVCQIALSLCRESH